VVSDIDNASNEQDMSNSETILPPANLIAPVQVLQTKEYTEGIVFDRQGNLYFSQTKSGTIMVLGCDGACRLWAKVTGANGHKILPDGTHLVAAQHAVVQFDATGKLLQVIAKEFQGKPLQYPNDITVDPQGGFYFTDSGNTNLRHPTGVVYYVNSAGELTQVITEIAFANGLVLTPDRQQLFVAESQRNRVLVFDVLSPGVVGAPRVFANLPVKQGVQIDNQPDGMCLDEIGNLFVAHYGMGQIVVLDRNGQIVHYYPCGNLTTSNCAFGGAKWNQLFVSGGITTEDGLGGIFRLDLGVSGLRLV
jgi:gluconolactonase